MGTGTLRFAIILALVVGGVLLIDQAFPEGSAESLPRPTEPVTPSATQTPDDGQAERPDGGDDETPAPPSKVVIGVYNGTSVTGLAGTTAEQLAEKPIYRIPGVAVGDTPSKPVNETTIYYRAAEDRVAAETLATSFFDKKKGLPDVLIERMPGDLEVPDSLDLAIYLGTDLV